MNYNTTKPLNESDIWRSMDTQSCLHKNTYCLIYKNYVWQEKGEINIIIKPKYTSGTLIESWGSSWFRTQFKFCFTLEEYEKQNHQHTMTHSDDIEKLIKKYNEFIIQDIIE